ncbi:twin-arginine translocation signal domain-containing protein [Halostella litorea]|uniref:twin-arginine translocation signal domain-containing protein n=1 Tax=Halostella litorea TaxID=2528831 RepID=UPI0010931F30|nr:twin-arginine translocation signal domain-containing protein [Halostella litorea]
MNRRTYLKLLAGTGATATLAGCWNDPSGEGTTAPTPGAPPQDPDGTLPTPEEPDADALAEEYGTVVDMVEDAGCDPDGSEPCDDAFREAAGDDTLLRFPAGTYRFEETNRVFEREHLGIVGDGDVTFEAPAGHNGKWIVVDRGRDLLFRNVRVDASADNCAPTLKLGVSDGLDVRDVRVVGRGIREGSRPRGEGGNVPVGSAFLPIVRSPDGEGVVERFVAREGGRIGTYNHGDGRVGIYIGPSHRGSVRLVDCRLEEFPNNGIYASRTNGVVSVEGGVFRNNDISQVRLGSEGSTLTGATIEVDVGDVGGPNAPGDYLNPRGVRIESGQMDTAGVAVRDTHVAVRDAPGSPGIAVGNNGGEFTVESSTVIVDSDGSTAILAKAPTGGKQYQPPPAPHGGRIENVQIGGSAATGYAVWIVERPETVVSNVRIDQRGENRDGLYVSRSPNCTLRNCTLLASRYPILVRPTPEPPSGCLVRLDAMQLLDAVGDVDALLDRFPGFIDRDETFCIEAEYADMGGVSDPIIAITGIGPGGVLKEVLSRRSLEE